VYKKNIRLIARLDIKGENLIKGVQLEGLRIIGSASLSAKDYYSQGIDELILMDSVASLYGRNHLADIIQEISKSVFVPLTVGGGIRSLDDAVNVLKCGADKVAINSAAVLNPQLIKQVSETLGSQAMVLSVEAKRKTTSSWEVYVNNGRETTGLDVLEWVQYAEKLGAGEILLTSVDKEGTRKGFDLVVAVNKVINIPVIASGGMGKLQDILDVVDIAKADAVAIADALHFKRFNLSEIRSYCIQSGIKLRNYV
jgi:cyclase